MSTVTGIKLRPYAHAGTRIVAFDGGIVLTADLAQLATVAPAAERHEVTSELRSRPVASNRGRSAG